MAATVLTATNVVAAGTQGTFSAPDAVDGVEFDSDTSAILVVRNGSVSDVTATIITPATLGGIPVEDPTVNCPAGTDTYIRVPAAAANNPATGRSKVVLSDVTSVTCALIS